MEQHFLDREKELFKLNAKLNAKSKKNVNKVNQAIKPPPIQIITSNQNLNYYHEEPEPESLEIKCKKINISSQPSKKSSDIAYLYNRNRNKKQGLNIFLPDSTSKDSEKETFENNEDGSQFTDTAAQTEETGNYKKDSSMVITRTTSESSLHLKHGANVDVIPKSLDKKHMTTDGLLKFLKAKVAMLQTELETARSQNDSIETDNKKLHRKLKKTLSQHQKICAKNLELEKSLNEVEEKKKISELTLIEKNCHIRELEDEIKKLFNNFTETNNEKQLTEKQLLKTQEEFEKANFKIEAYKNIEETMNESAEKERIIFEEKMRNLRKGKADLLKAYKQQIILIDNLKRQNICLEKAKSLEICEKEFLKVLDWNFGE